MLLVGFQVGNILQSSEHQRIAFQVLHLFVEELQTVFPAIVKNFLYRSFRTQDASIMKIAGLFERESLGLILIEFQALCRIDEAGRVILFKDFCRLRKEPILQSIVCPFRENWMQMISATSMPRTERSRWK